MRLMTRDRPPEARHVMADVDSLLVVSEQLPGVTRVVIRSLEDAEDAKPAVGGEGERHTGQPPRRLAS